MTLSISHPEPGARLGADQCPGVDQQGHGLTMTVIHDAGCCREWETGQAATPARAESFRQAAPGGARPGRDSPSSPRSPGITAPAPNPRASATPGTPTCRPSAQPHPNPNSKPSPADRPTGTRKENRP